MFVILTRDDEEWEKTIRYRILAKLGSCVLWMGETRAESVINGLKAARGISSISDEDWVLVHDAARPCLIESQLDRLVDELSEDEVAGVLADSVAEYLKRRRASVLKLTKGKQVRRKPHRCFAIASTWPADAALDDAGAIEALGLRQNWFSATRAILKVTYPQDLVLAELILSNS